MIPNVLHVVAHIMQGLPLSGIYFILLLPVVMISAHECRARDRMPVTPLTCRKLQVTNSRQLETLQNRMFAISPTAHRLIEYKGTTFITINL